MSSKMHRTIGTSEDAVHIAEQELNRKLPKSFVEWIIENNGRSVNDIIIFPVFDSRDPKTTWDSIVRNYNHSWPEWQDTFADTDLDFSNLLPFGEFGTGDYYCFDYGQQGKTGEPAIVLWSHETGEITKIAESFDDFLINARQ